VIYQTNAIWPYAKTFTLDMIVNKTFKFDPEGKHTITFDENGFATNSSDDNAYYTGCLSKNTYESNTSLNSDGILIRKWYHSYLNLETNTTESYSGQNERKLLATDSDIGYITVSRHYDKYDIKYHEYVSSMIFNTATEKPVDMSTKLPYITYSSWDLENKNGIKYNIDGTIEYFDKDGVYDSDNNFTIENGQIVTTYDYNGTNYEFHHITKTQIVFSIGDYDVLKVIDKHSYKDYQVSYKDINDSWVSVDLNDSIKTFYDLFALTNNRMDDNIYDLDSGTYSDSYSSNTFTISNDGKTLTTCWSANDCHDRTIENGAIVSEYSDEYYETVKTTPYF
jgi:hypothetical protein